MSADWYYYIGFGVSAVLIVLTSLSYVVEVKNQGFKKVKKSGVAIIVFVCILMWANCGTHKANDVDKKQSDSTNTARYNSLRDSLHNSNNLILTEANKINDLLDAIKQRGYYYDTNRKELTPILVEDNSVHMANPKFNGKTMIGGKDNTQN